MTPHALVLLVLFSSVACSSEDEPDDEDQRILDMAGAEFFWTGTDVHRIAGVSPPLLECSKGTPDYRLISGTRFAKVASGCQQEHGFAGWYGDDRMVVCDDADDCPLRESVTYECRAGFCQDVEGGPMYYFDAFSLCYGHEPRRDDDSYWSHHGSELDDAIYDVCPGGNPEPCEGPLPAECPDPD